MGKNSFALIEQTSLPIILSSDCIDPNGRKGNDYYPTTDAPLLIPPLIKSLEETTLFDSSSIVIEPCAGKLDLVNAIKSNCKNIRVEYSDINGVNSFNPPTYDARSFAYWDYVKEHINPDWMITNLPFNEAMPILTKAFEVCNIGVVSLLRWSFLEPTEDRGDWLKFHSKNAFLQMPFNPRPQFRKGEINPKTSRKYGSDSVTTAFLGWVKDDHLPSIPKDYLIYQPCDDWKPKKNSYINPQLSS